MKGTNNMPKRPTMETTTEEPQRVQVRTLADDLARHREEHEAVVADCQGLERRVANLESGMRALVAQLERRHGALDREKILGGAR